MDAAPCSMALPNLVAQAIEFVSESETALLLLLLIEAKDGLDQRFPSALSTPNVRVHAPARRARSECCRYAFAAAPSAGEAALRAGRGH